MTSQAHRNNSKNENVTDTVIKEGKKHMTVFDRVKSNDLCQKMRQQQVFIESQQ